MLGPRDIGGRALIGALLITATSCGLDKSKSLDVTTEDSSVRTGPDSGVDGGANGDIVVGGNNGMSTSNNAGGGSNGTSTSGSTGNSSGGSNAGSGGNSNGGSSGNSDGASTGIATGGTTGVMMDPPNPLAGTYAVRTVVYARQSSMLAGDETPRDFVSKGQLISIANINEQGEVREKYCFIETSNDERISSWTRPSSTQLIPETTAKLVREGDTFVRRAVDDQTYISWSPSSVPAECVAGQTITLASGRTCLCPSNTAIPTDPKDCRVTDLDLDSRPGGSLLVDIGRPGNPETEEPLLSLDIVGSKAIEWRLPAAPAERLIGTVAGGLEQSEVGRNGEQGVLELFSKIGNALCRNDTGHVELVRGDFDCAKILAGRDPKDVDESASESDDNGTADRNLTSLDSFGIFTQRDAKPPTLDQCDDPCPSNDSDKDGLFDCYDACPDDANKTQRQQCGCGVAETDSDEDGAPDCVDPPHPLRGKYVARTVLYARQRAEVRFPDAEPSELDVVSKGTLLSTVDIDANGKVTEHYCYIETTNADGISSWTRPSNTELIADGETQLSLEGTEYVRTLVDDQTYISWSPDNVPADCQPGKVSPSEGCLCPSDDELPTDPNDCRVTDLDADNRPGGQLLVNFGRPVDPEGDDGLVALDIVGTKAVEWRLPANASAPIIGKIKGGLEQSEVGRSGDAGLIGVFSKIGNAVCSDVGHVELVESDLNCTALLALRKGELSDDENDTFGGTFIANDGVAPDKDSCDKPCTSDRDGDKKVDCFDDCPNDANKTFALECGCGVPDIDADKDKTPSCIDKCDNDANKTSEGVCGCGTADTNSDTDPVLDCRDGCPFDSNKTLKGLCGCGTPDTNTDKDSQPDCIDECDNDANKTVAGVCGCGTADTNSDGDSTPDCKDLCPRDSGKIAAGVCGCGVADIDTDGDKTLDCKEDCDTDANKTVAGVCGCGVPDTNSDSDNVVNCRDNCDNAANPDQADWNADGEGDACDDSDSDTILDSVDNCRSTMNRDQADFDGDKLGDVCDADDDNDGTADANEECDFDRAKTTAGQCGCGVPDVNSDSDNIADCRDNCDNVANQDQADFNSDGQGDACDDTDGDTILDSVDNCRSNTNQNQADNDADRQGDVCDTDDDNDGVLDANEECDFDRNKTAAGQCGCGALDTNSDSDSVADCKDNCDNIANASQADFNSDGQGDACDDTDSDTVLDDVDNCRSDPNGNQANNDRDAQGDVCDADDDNDNVPDLRDNCPLTANPDQADEDGNGTGDACDDNDDDDDGVLDMRDNCQLIPNPKQENNDRDAQGDACDSDDDNDGTLDVNEECDFDPNKTAVGQCGCGNAETNSDSDSIANCRDNCDNIANQDQADFNNDGEGDVCDDTDGDTVVDSTDNCRSSANQNQSDFDQDRQGDVCDADDDNDGALDVNEDCDFDRAKTVPGQCGCSIADTNSDSDSVADCKDNCDNTANQDQADFNNDGQGDVCDDTDGDTVFDSGDNCRSNANTNQADFDGDRQGDVCDTDDDNDGTLDANEDCDFDRNKTLAGQCGCGIADTNSDSDSVADCRDNCDNAANQDQADFNSDGQGDACDDTDGDTILDSADNCRSNANQNQADNDRDRQGDVCDTDDDNDGTLDANEDCDFDANKTTAGQCGCGSPDVQSDADGVADCRDNCDNAVNADQADFNNDGQGDVCDDTDGDTVLDSVDNCRQNANTDQKNTDRAADGGDACDNDDDNDGTPDGNDGCPIDATKTSAGQCGCGVPEGTCPTQNPLVGTYAVRSLVFAKRQNAGSSTVTTSKGINLSLVTITDNGDGTLKLVDKSCFSTAVPNPSDATTDRAYSWSRASWVQAMPAVERTVVDQRNGTWLRRGVSTQVGFSSALQPTACAGTATTGQRTDIVASTTPLATRTGWLASWSSDLAGDDNCNCGRDPLPRYDNNGAPYECRLYDQDADGFPGVSAFVATGNWTTVDGTPSGGSRVFAVANAINQWTITPAANGDHTFTVDDKSQSMLVGCVGASGSGTGLCGFTPSAAPSAWSCPAQFNTGKFHKVSSNATCADVLNTTNTSQWFGTDDKYLSSSDPAWPPTSQCPKPQN